MNNPEFYRNLQFEVRPRLTMQRLVFIGLSLIIFTILWLFVSHSTLYWALFLLVGILAWVASYGWRQALAATHEMIHELEQR